MILLRLAKSALITAMLIYASIALAALVSIPVGYFVIAPGWHFIHSLPPELMQLFLQIGWMTGFALVAAHIIQDYLQPTAGRSYMRAHPDRLRLADQAPWLQVLEVSEGEAAAPALSPPRKSLPSPEHD